MILKHDTLCLEGEIAEELASKFVGLSVLVVFILVKMLEEEVEHWKDAISSWCADRGDSDTEYEECVDLFLGFILS